MRSSLGRAAEALLGSFGIRRKSARRERGEDDGDTEDSESGWEVDPCQFVGAVTGALVAWWAMGRLKTLQAAPAALSSAATRIGADDGSSSHAAIAPLSKLPLSEFLRLLRAGAVTAVTYLADKPPAGALLVKARTAPMLAPTTAETLLLPGCHQGLFEELRACDGVLFECAEVAAEAAGDDFGRLSLLIDAGSLLVVLGTLGYMLRGGGQVGGGFTGQRLEDQTAATDNRSSVTFDDVAGMESTKEELREVISFLRNPESFYALGARPPRGILLAGPSGTGKTLLARAVAGEAGVPFLYASSAAFVEIYVGQGAQRVRQFFEQARSCAPCIVFLDELDAVGSSRQMVASGGNQEYAQTLNQLLLELDGIESHSSSSGGGATGSRSGNPEAHRTVVTMAATNRYDALDEALVRPGRLDRIVLVSLPNLAERQATLEIHARRLRTEGLNFEALARRTEGRSGAELANVLNEAALLAARRGAAAVGPEHVDEVLRNPRPTQQQEQERRAQMAGDGACFHRGPPEFDLHPGMSSHATSPEAWARFLASVAASIASSGGDVQASQRDAPLAEEVENEALD